MGRVVKMNKIMVGGYEDNFLNIYSREKREFVLCGDEGTLYRLQPYLPPADFFWDVLGRGGGFGDLPFLPFRPEGQESESRLRPIDSQT